MKNIHYKILAIYLGALLLFFSGSLQAAPMFQAGDCLGQLEFQKYDFSKVDGSTIVVTKVTAMLVITEVNDKSKKYSVRSMDGKYKESVQFDQLDSSRLFKINCYPVGK